MTTLWLNSFIMKIIKILIAIVIPIISLSSGCDKNEICATHYFFQLPVTINSTDTINIGDTLIVEAKIPYKLLNEKTGDSVFVGKYYFKTEISIDIPDSTLYGNGEAAGYDDFDFIQFNGEISPLTFSSGHTYGQLLYDSLETYQIFKYGFVPKKEGYYTFGFLSFYSINTNVSEEYFSREVNFTNTDCKELLFTEYKTNDGTLDGNNFYIFESHGGNNRSNWKDEYYINSGSFSFVVRE